MQEKRQEREKTNPIRNGSQYVLLASFERESANGCEVAQVKGLGRTVTANVPVQRQVGGGFVLEQWCLSGDHTAGSQATPSPIEAFIEQLLGLRPSPTGSLLQAVSTLPSNALNRWSGTLLVERSSRILTISV